MKHIKIGVDMDDILFDINPGIINYYNDRNKTSYSVEDVKGFYLEELFGCSKEEMAEIIKGFHSSEHHSEASTVPGSKEGIENLKKYDLVLISARHADERVSTEDWLHKHFPNIFSSVQLLGRLSGAEEMKVTKGVLARELGIKIFIEDSLSNAKDIAEHGIPVILLEKIWNQGELPPAIHRVKTWEEIVSKVEELLKAQS